MSWDSVPSSVVEGGRMLFTATTTTGSGTTVEAIPLDRVREVLSRYGA